MTGCKYKAVEALMVKWDYHDLGRGLVKEGERVYETFRKLRFKTETIAIPLNDGCTQLLKESLQAFLPSKKEGGEKQTLRIIYYHGHGKTDRSQNLSFFRYTPRALLPPSYYVEADARRAG